MAKRHAPIPAPELVECVDDAMAAALREKAPGERLAVADAMVRAARAIIEGSVRSDHPDWSSETVRREVARRLSHGAV